MNGHFINILQALDYINEGGADYQKEYKDYVEAHKERVKKFADWLKTNCPDLFEGVNLDVFDDMISEHDESKFSEEEFEPYAQKWFGNGEETREYQLAWEHHYMNNEHHPEYWDGEDMPYIYILEMICDWGSFSIDKGDLKELSDFYYNKAKADPEKNLSDATQEIIEDILSRINSVIGCEELDEWVTTSTTTPTSDYQNLFTEWLDSSGAKIDTSTPSAPITTSATTAKTSGNLYVVFNYYRPNDLDDFCLLHVDASKSATIDALIEMAEQSVENYGRYKNTLVCYKIDPDEFDMTDDDFIEAAESKHDYCGEGLHYEYTEVVYTLSYLAANEKPLYELNRSLVEIEYYDEFLSKNSHLVGLTMNDIYDSNFDSNLISQVYNDAAFQKFMKDRLTKTITNSL